MQKYDSILGTLQYLWDEWNLLREELLGVDVLRFTDWPGAWGGLVSNHQGSGSFFYGFDALEDTRLLAGSNATVQDLYSYRAFGETVQTAGTDRNPYQYGGQSGYYSEESPAVSRLYVRMRQLRADQGRWMSRDPLGGDWNLYRYVRNRPTVFSDPIGLLSPTAPPTGLPYTRPTVEPLPGPGAGAAGAEIGEEIGIIEFLPEVGAAIGIGYGAYSLLRYFRLIDSSSLQRLRDRISNGEFGKTQPKRNRLRCLVDLYWDEERECITIFDRGGSYSLLHNIRRLMRLMNSADSKNKHPECDPDKVEIHHMPQAAYIKKVTDPNRRPARIRPYGEAPGVGMLHDDHVDTRSYGAPPPYNRVDPTTCHFIGDTDFEGDYANDLQLDDILDVLRGGRYRRFPNRYLRGLVEARAYSRVKWPTLFLRDPRENYFFGPGVFEWLLTQASRNPRFKKRGDPGSGPC